MPPSDLLGGPQLSPDRLRIAVGGAVVCEGERFGVKALQVHHEHYIVAGTGRIGAYDGVLGDAPDNGDIELIVRAVGMRVAPDYGHAELGDAVLHAPQQVLPAGVFLDRQHVDHG